MSKTDIGQARVTSVLGGGANATITFGGAGSVSISTASVLFDGVTAGVAVTRRESRHGDVNFPRRE